MEKRSISSFIQKNAILLNLLHLASPCFTRRHLLRLSRMSLASRMHCLANWQYSRSHCLADTDAEMYQSLGPVIWSLFVAGQKYRAHSLDKPLWISNIKFLALPTRSLGDFHSCRDTQRSCDATPQICCLSNSEKPSPFALGFSTFTAETWSSPKEKHKQKKKLLLKGPWS